MKSSLEVPDMSIVGSISDFKRLLAGERVHVPSFFLAASPAPASAASSWPSPHPRDELQSRSFSFCSLKALSNPISRETL